MRHLLAAAALLGCLGACTADNPDYVPSPDGAGVADLSGGGSDDLTSPGAQDLTSPPARDLGGPPECQPGERSCRTAQGRSFSRYCRAGAFADDRPCPSDSTCKDGYCQVPPLIMGTVQGGACVRESDCFRNNMDYTCTPFVQRNNGGLVVNTFCARPMLPNQQGGAGTQCKPDDSSPCRTGFCDLVPYSDNGTNVNYCFRRCVSAIDCPNRPPNVTYHCRDSRTDVEGQIFTSGGVGSCIPD